MDAEAFWTAVAVINIMAAGGLFLAALCWVWESKKLMGLTIALFLLTTTCIPFTVGLAAHYDDICNYKVTVSVPVEKL